MPGDAFHRFGDEYWTEAEWGKSAPEIVKRVVLAVGSEPLEDARHLLAPLPLQTPVSEHLSQDDAPDETISFVLEVSGQRSVSLLTVLEILNADARGALNFPRLWGRTQDATSESPWFPLPFYPLEALLDAHVPLKGAAFSWTLSHLASQGRAAVRELEGYQHEVQKRFAPLGWNVVPRETPEAAASRSARLNRIKARFARPVEMRLIPQGRPFPSRQVWRSAYALGLVWGEMDLFHWHDPKNGRRLFTLSSTGQPGYFLPERAAEGEGVAGLSLGFELPAAPAPLHTFDRMAVALDYLRHQLGGRPSASDGAEMDAERLDSDRESLEEAVAEMACAGIAPGTPEAARYF